MKTIFWDRRPGFFVDKTSGTPLNGVCFTGMTVEWYHSLYETIFTEFPDAKKIICSRDVLTIFECITSFRPAFEPEDLSSAEMNESFAGEFVRASYAYEGETKRAKVFISNESPNVITIVGLGHVVVKGMDIY